MDYGFIHSLESDDASRMTLKTLSALWCFGTKLDMESFNRGPLSGVFSEFEAHYRNSIQHHYRNEYR